MRICLITREFPPDTGWGGIGTFMHDLALGLSENGHEVEVVSLSDCAEESMRIDYAVKVHRVAAQKQLDNYQRLLTVMPYSHGVLKQVCALNEKFIALHAQEPFDVVEVPEMFGEGIFISMSKIAPLVIRLHTPHFKLMEEGLHLIDQSFDHQFLAIAEKVAIMQADAVTCPSQDLAAYVSSRTGYPLSAISIIRNHVDTRRFVPEGARSLEVVSGKIPVLFVGRLEERKGVYTLAKAVAIVVAQFPNVHFYLVGKDTNSGAGGCSVERQLREELERAGCLQFVTFTGPKLHDDMPSVYRSAEICILPSLYENAPITCIEAMASQVAVIATSAGGSSEYVEHGVSGLIIPPSDVEALSQAILLLLKDPERRHAIATAARQKTVTDYDRRETARHSAELYEKAHANFSNSRQFALFKRNIEEEVPSFYQLLGSFDRMLYGYTYRHSSAFRMRYWWHMMKARPKLGMLGVVLEMGTSLASMLGLKRAENAMRRFSTKAGTDPFKAINTHD